MIIRIIISGDVIGVSFRAFLKEHADRLKIKGYVKNTNENVEAVFEGSKENIEKLIESCKEGPSSANVDHVEVFEEKSGRKFDGFEIII